MPQDIKTKHVAATHLKTSELPDDVRKAAEGEDIDKWYYATVETKDREGDIVRIGGIDTAKYAQNGCPIKVLVNHQRSPDGQGRLPIAGKVVKWVPTKHKATGLPAMAAGLKFVKTDLGNEIKTLADENLLDVSIGFEAEEHAPIAGAGTDYTKSAIAEISVCVTGMNQFAGVLRALDKDEKAIADAEARAKAADKTLIDTITKHIDAKFAEHAAALLEANTNTIKRLDDLEDTLSNLPKPDAAQIDRSEHLSPKISLDSLRALLAAS